jgi:hemolysin III
MSRLKDFIDTRISLARNVESRDDRLSSLSHAAGFILSLAATGHLVRLTAGNRVALAASLVYGLTMITVFGASAVYHGLRVSTAKRVFRLLDHSSIYLLIAGTYTPYAAAIPDGAGRPLLIAIWSLGLAGLILNILLWDRVKWLHISIYLLMGWLLVFFWRPFFNSAPRFQLIWMMIGGFFYTAGIFFYLARSIPRGHFIWHLFVIAGAAGLHAGIVLYAIPVLL